MTAPASRRVELRRLQDAMNAASDAQVARIVGVIDRLPERGAADALVAALRPRLRHMGLARPLTLTRLLFQPVEPLLLAGPAWKRGRLGIPRTAIEPIARAVHEGLGAATAGIEAAIAGRLSTDHGAIHAAGSRLWPAAAAVVERPGMPAGWVEATGLAEADHVAIARCLAAVLSEAVWLDAMALAAAEGEPVEEAELRAWLEAATERHPEPKGALLTVLLARVPQAMPLLAATPSQPPQAGLASEPAIDFLLERLESGTGLGQDLAAAGAELHQAALLLESLEAPGPCQRPSRKAHLERLRGQLAQVCRQRYAEALEKTLLARLASGADAPGADALGDGSLEDIARNLRRLELAGRRLGGGEHYERLVQQAVRLIGEGERASRVPRARLIEILAGPDAALPVLEDAS
jgi:hypothetical protein